MRHEIDESISPLDSLRIDLAPEGDTMESEEAAEMDISEAQPEQVQQQDLAIPPPQMMAHRGPAAHDQEGRSEAGQEGRARGEHGALDRRQQASVRHRLGVAGGRAGTMSRAGYAGLLAAAIARHVPSTTSSPGPARRFAASPSRAAVRSRACPVRARRPRMRPCCVRRSMRRGRQGRRRAAASQPRNRCISIYSIRISHACLIW